MNISKGNIWNFIQWEDYVMIDGLDTAGGYGEFGNLAEVVEMEEMSY